MQTYVTDEQMDNVWQEVCRKSESQILAMQKRHRKEQKVLVNFACDHLLDLREDAAGVGIYVFHVIVEAFSGAFPRPQPVRRPEITQVLMLSDETLAQEVKAIEPHAAQYLEEALAEEGDVMLFDEEQVYFTHIIQIAILCLHMACEKRAELLKRR
jgi:hypothetical protein